MLSSIRDLLQQLWKQVKPPKPFSWQMLVLLSIFSFLISTFINNGLIQEILDTLGWGFLILAIGWATATLSISLLGFKFLPGSWITGAMVLIWLRDWGWVDLRSQLVLWPIVTAVVASIPRFLAPGPNVRIPKPSDRQYIVIVVLSHIVMSCWVGFGFLIQGWVEQYPATLVDSFDRSAFVMPVSLDVTTNNRERSPAETMLNQAQLELEETLERKTWDETMQWLRNDNNEFARPRQNVLETIVEANSDDPDADLQDSQDRNRFEQRFWDFGTTVPQGIQGIDDGYTITFRACWLGPSSHPEGYYLDKTCNLLNRSDYQQLQQEVFEIPVEDPPDAAQDEDIEEPDTLESIRDSFLEQIQQLPDRLLPEEDPADAPGVVVLCEDPSDVKYPQDADDRTPVTAQRTAPFGE